MLGRNSFLILSRQVFYLVNDVLILALGLEVRVKDLQGTD